VTGSQPKRWLPLVAAPLLAALIPATAMAQPPDGEPLAIASVYTGGVDFRAQVEFARAVVTISGGDVLFTRVFEAGEQPSIEPYDLEGNLLPDGEYSWRLELIPGAEAARKLRIEATQSKEEPASAWRALTGTFGIRGGLVAIPDLGEGPQSGPERDSSSSFGSGFPSSGFARTAPVEDDDAAVGMRVGVEEAAREAAGQMVTPVIPGAGGRELFERSDAATLAMGGSLEPPVQLQIPNVLGDGTRTPRSISPDGKDGRPRSRDESR